MLTNIIEFLFIQHSQDTLATSIAFYTSVLLLINLETIIAAIKQASKLNRLI